MTAVKDPDSGRDQAIERLIGQYQTPLLRLCYMQLQDRALAEGIVKAWSRGTSESDRAPYKVYQLV